MERAFQISETKDTIVGKNLPISVVKKVFAVEKDGVDGKTLHFPALIGTVVLSQLLLRT